MLRRALWERGQRYRLHRRDLLGRPDITFGRQRVAVFCDGDFWHGKDWESRRGKLGRGANSGYWIAKISANMTRDRAITERLISVGWVVLRFWESEIRADVRAVADQVCAALERAANQGSR